MTRLGKALAGAGARRAYLCAALLAALLVCGVLRDGIGAEDVTPVSSGNGVWDLRGFDFSSETAHLRGPVEHVPDALLTPEEFAARADDAVLGDALGANQYATSRVVILMEDDRYYTFSRISTDFAERVFVNGVWLTDVGSPGATKEETVPFTSRITFTVRPVDGAVEIVTQNSNFVHRKGGHPEDWRVGGYGYANQVLRVDYTVNIILGCYLALALVFLVLFFLLRRYPPNLYFALFCLMWFLRSGVTGVRAFAVLAPWLSGPASMRIEYIAMPAGAVLVLAITRSLLPGVLQPAVLRAVCGFSGVFAAVFLFVDTVYMSYAILACEALYLACAVYLLARLAFKLRRPDTPQAVFVAGLLIFLYGAVRDFFFYNGIYALPPFDEANLTQIAVLGFVFCQAVALFMATMREVEDAKAAERQLADENAALERANQLRADVMETISHEARTPLAVLASYSSLVALELREGAAGEQVTEDLDKIAHEAIRVANLINEMKRLPLEPGRRAAPTDVDIAELVEQTARLYRPMLLRRGVALTLDIADGLPHASGNPAELTQVVFNLLQNAKNSTSEGTVAVSATADGEVETRRVSVRVADTGSGIDPELLPHVFERGTSGDGQSTGLGLAICKEIIEAHGGQIAINSLPGAGTVAAVTLPAREGGESVVG